MLAQVMLHEQQHYQCNTSELHSSVDTQRQMREVRGWCPPPPPQRQFCGPAEMTWHTADTAVMVDLPTDLCSKCDACSVPPPLLCRPRSSHGYKYSKL